MEPRLLVEGLLIVVGGFMAFAWKNLLKRVENLEHFQEMAVERFCEVEKQCLTLEKTKSSKS